MQLTEKKRPPRFIRWFSGIYIAATMGLLAVLFVPYGVNAEGTSSPLFLGSWAILYAGTWAVIFLKGVDIYTRDTPLIALILLVLASVFWSDNPNKTALYGAAFTSNIAFSFVLRRYYNLDEFLQLVLKVIMAMTISGVILYIIGFQPTKYIDVHDRTTFLGTEPIRGLSNHKITAGLYAAIGIVLAIDQLRGIRRLLSCIYLVSFILLTGSSSSLAILLVGIAFLFVVCRFSSRLSPFSFFSTIALLGLLLSIFLIADAESLLSLLGRDTTLTGRTTLWAWGLDVASQKPIFGWGFLGYMGSDNAQAYARTLPGFSTYEAPHFHDSYIQMFAELGLVGLAVCLWIMLRSVYNLYTSALREKNNEAALACSIVLMLMFSAIFVHVFFKYNDFPSIFFSCCFLMSKEYFQKELYKNLDKNTLALSAQNIR